MVNTVPRVAIIGEAMLELSHAGPDLMSMAYGGDTLNTAVYMARLGCKPNFITALGNDPYSANLINQWAIENVATDFVLHHPTRMPGLYAIQTDDHGEREFYYWREHSAARDLFNLEGIKQAIEFAKRANWLYLSGITLSIFSPSERETLVKLARIVKDNKGVVVFDPNYRPKGWKNKADAQQAIALIAPNVTFALPTLDDENALYGETQAINHANRWLALGTNTVVIKNGAQGALIYDRQQDEQLIKPRTQVQATDTTGAGDSFNAAFMSARIQGATIVKAVLAGHYLAEHVIQYSGAIIPKPDMPTIEQ